MRILQVVPSLQLVTGGPAVSVAAISRGLAAQGFYVTLLTTDWPNRPPRRQAATMDNLVEGISLHTFPSSICLAAPHLPYSPPLLERVRSVARLHDFALVHSMWNPVASLTVRLLRQQGIPYAVMLHGMMDPVVLLRRRWRKAAWACLCERANIESAELIISTTSVAQHKALQAGWKMKRMLVMPHPIPVKDWENLPPRTAFEDLFPAVRGRDVLLYVGRINWVKNLDRLIEALPMIRRERPSAMLVLAGPDEPRYRRKLERLIGSLGLQEDVLFTGILDRPRLKAAYARAGVLALVSRKENFGLAAAEALAAGVPLVLSEGVDLGHHWPSDGPVARVRAEAPEISSALARMLRRGDRTGLPDPGARRLAEAEFGQNRISDLVDAIARLHAERLPRNGTPTCVDPRSQQHPHT